MISYKEIQVLSQLVYSLDISVEKLSEPQNRKDFDDAKTSVLEIQKKIKEEIKKIKDGN